MERPDGRWLAFVPSHPCDPMRAARMGHPEIRLPAGRLRCSYANELCKRSAQGLEFKIAFDM
jgi:hypothetical protein